MPQLTSTQSSLILSVAKGNSLIVRNRSGVETVTGSSVAREDATAVLGSGAYVYGPQTSASTLTISTTGVLDYDIVAGDPTPARDTARVVRNAATGSPSSLVDPATGQPVGGGGGTPVERFARKVAMMRERGVDPQFPELAALPAAWSAGTYKRGKVIANAAQTLCWIASNDGVAASAAAPTRTDVILTPDNAHNWQFVGPIATDRLTRKQTLFDASGNRVQCAYLRQTQNNTAMDATFVGQFGAASGYDLFTTSTAINVQSLYAQVGGWDNTLRQMYTYAGGGWQRPNFSDVALAFYTDSPRVGLHSSWDQRGRLNVDGVDLTFSEEIDPPTGDGALGWQRTVWRDLNFGWSAVRRIELNGSANLTALVVQKGYRVWPANDIADMRGAYYGDSTAAGGGPSPIRANDQWIPCAMKTLTGSPSAIRYATGGVGYARSSNGDILNSTNQDNLLGRTVNPLNLALMDVSLGALPLDYVWLDQTSWDIPGIDATYPTMDQFEQAFSLVVNAWLTLQPQCCIIVSTYRGDSLTIKTLTDPYVARMKDICNRLIPKDRLILIDPYNKVPMPYVTSGVSGYSSNQQVFWGQGNGNYYTDGAHPSQAYHWIKGREAAADVWAECVKVLAGVDRGYGRA